MRDSIVKIDRMRDLFACTPRSSAHQAARAHCTLRTLRTARTHDGTSTTTQRGRAVRPARPHLHHQREAESTRHDQTHTHSTTHTKRHTRTERRHTHKRRNYDSQTGGATGRRSHLYRDHYILRKGNSHRRATVLESADPRRALHVPPPLRARVAASVLSVWLARRPRHNVGDRRSRAVGAECRGEIPTLSPHPAGCCSASACLRCSFRSSCCIALHPKNAPAHYRS